MKNNRWELLLKVKGGHRYFAELSHVGLRTGRIGIADNSGRYPEDTDDGVLVYDPSRVVVLGSQAFRIPVKKDRDDRLAQDYWTGEENDQLFDVLKVLGVTHVEPTSQASVFDKWVAVQVNDNLLKWKALAEQHNHTFGTCGRDCPIWNVVEQ